MNYEGGYIRLYRRLYDKPAFRNKGEAGVFAWMVVAAQWRPTTIRTKYGPVSLGIGELIIAERGLAAEFGLHRNTVRALLQRLVDDHAIELFQDRCPYHAGTIVRVVNYAEYQGVGEGPPSSEDQLRADGKTDTGPMRDRSGTKNKEEKERKEGKEKNIGGAAAPRPKGTQIAEDWLPEVAERAFASDKGYGPAQIQDMAIHFVSHHTAKGTASKDWPASWRTWVLQDIKFHGAPNARKRAGGRHPFFQAADDLLAGFGAPPSDIASQGGGTIIEHAPSDEIPF